MNVLIIDDSPEFIKLLKRIFEASLKTTNLVEYDIQQGKPDKNFDWSPYDVLLLDYNLGGGDDGIEWLRSIRKHENLPPIIMLTGEGNEYIAVNAIKLGATDYLNKNDITPGRIINAIKGALSERAGENKALNRTTTRTSTRSKADALSTSGEHSVQTDKTGNIDVGSGYKFVSQIASGGMSRVYLAERLGDKQTCVLKVLALSEDTDEVLVTRFVREAELLSGLDSPYVAKVYDYGLTNEYAYIAMEFFSRGDLKQRMEQDLQTRVALSHMINVAYGLDAIHHIGIAHRDLKPANIMFRGDDSLAIADFGIAKKINTSFDITQTGEILGSPHYMSPEQASGKQIDCSTDIYSYGVILFEILTGKKPFTGKSPAEIIYQLKYGTTPELPQEYSNFQEIINHTMAKDAASRYDSKKLVLAMEGAFEEF